MSIVSTHVQKYYQNTAGFTEYFILILYQGREWAVRKRYSEFVRLDEFLRISGHCINYQLPEKNWWNKFDPSLLSKRLKELQCYLDVLLRETVTAENSLVREFLEVDENMLALAKKKSFKEISYSDKMVLIVKQMRKVMIGIPSNRDSLGDACVCARPYRAASTHYFTYTSSAESPRKMSKESFNGNNNGNGRYGNGNGHGGSFDGRIARTGIGSFSGGVGTMRTGIGSFSGNVNSVDAALAVADAARREAFASHVLRLWKLVGKQTEEKMLALEWADRDLPIPYGAMYCSDTFSDSPGESSSEPEGGSTAATGRDDNAWIIERLSEPLQTARLTELLVIEADKISEQLPKNRIVFIGGNPSSCVRQLVVPHLAEKERSPHGPPSSPSIGEAAGRPSSSPLQVVGRDQLRRNNSEGTGKQGIAKNKPSAIVGTSL